MNEFNWLFFIVVFLVFLVVQRILGFLSPPDQPELRSDPRIARDRHIRELEEELGISNH